jgi:hypothetical protein
LSCLVLCTPRAGRTLPAGEGGCAAVSLPPSHYLKLGPAVRCRSSPEFPFRFIWVLGWSTWYLVRGGGAFKNTCNGIGPKKREHNRRPSISKPHLAFPFLPLGSRISVPPGSRIFGSRTRHPETHIATTTAVAWSCVVDADGTRAKAAANSLAPTDRSDQWAGRSSPMGTQRCERYVQLSRQGPGGVVAKERNPARASAECACRWRSRRKR